MQCSLTAKGSVLVVDRQRQSALAGVLRPGRSGVLDGDVSVQLQQLQPAAMVQINGAQDEKELHSALSAFELLRAPAPLECAAGAQVRLLWNGPGCYLVVSESRQPEALLSLLACRRVRRLRLNLC